MDNSSDSGIIGSEKEDSEPDIEYKEVARHIGEKKVIIEDAWQESINPLATHDAVFDHDLEIFQYYGNEALMKQSGKQSESAQKDRAKLAKQKVQLPYKPTIKVKTHTTSKPSFMEKFKKRIKLKKK